MLISLFEKVLSMSMLGCYVILVVLLVRLLLRRCERKYSFLLWFVVFFNLCLPFSIEGPFSLVPFAWVEWSQMATEEKEAPLQESANTNIEGTQNKGVSESQQPEIVDIQYVEMVTEGNSTDATAQQNELPKQTNLQISIDDAVQGVLSGRNIAASLWLVVIAVLWIVNIYKGAVLSKQLKKSKENDGISEEGIVYAEGIAAPFLWGIRKPLIYLPENLEEAEKSYIIAHESYHRKRFDYITKPVVFLISTIHWFNPLVWVAYAFFIRDMEISCDEAVLSHAQRDIKKQYASSLLKYAAKQNGFVFLPLTFGEPSLKSRIENVLHYKKRGVMVTVAAVGMVALTACGLIVRPQIQDLSAEQTDLKQETMKVPESTYVPSATKTPKPEKNPETIKEDSLMPPSEQKQEEWLQTILEIRSETGKNARDFGWENSVLPTFSEMTGDEEAVYGDSGDVTVSSDYVLECWMKLENGTLLENLRFDLKEVMKEKQFTRAFVTGVFYREELNQVYIALPVLDVGGGVMIVSFSPDAPKDYEVHAYKGMSVWFGECVMIGDDIYLHAANGSCPWRIHIETWEIYYTEKEFEHTQKLTEGFRKEYEAKQGRTLSLQWFYASGRVGNVEVYTGYLGEDVSSTAATVYTGYEDGEWIGAMIIDEKTEEVRFPNNLQQAVSPVILKTSSREFYNTILEVNGYQYYFQLDMNSAQMKLEIGDSVEEERYYGNVQVRPVFVSDGDQTKQLGVLRNYTFDVTSDFLVEPSRVDGERLCGKLKNIEEGGLALYQAEAVDRDTYTEYINISEEEESYRLAENTEFVMLDANFRNVSVTYDRFLEHLSKSEDTIYYITVRDGKIVQVWEPYSP